MSTPQFKRLALYRFVLATIMLFGMLTLGSSSRAATATITDFEVTLVQPSGGGFYNPAYHKIECSYTATWSSSGLGCFVHLIWRNYDGPYYYGIGSQSEGITGFPLAYGGSPVNDSRTKNVAVHWYGLYILDVAVQDFQTQHVYAVDTRTKGFP
jgi:hypothetical protein